MNLERLLSDHQSPVALVIGNGIHRHRAAQSGNDWNQMMQNLAVKYGLDVAHYEAGLALTELYDLIDLKTPTGQKASQLQSEFCDRMDEWEALDHHREIAGWAMRREAPVLTTNFDHVLANSVDAKLFSMFRPRADVKGPTDYYPWEKYFAYRALTGPCDSFGIWHINGMIEHIRSIRLGLSHYMGSVSRVRPWIHGEKETRLFSRKNLSNWRGRETWLHIIFNMPLLIIGLGLETQEVFLRWLLIERKKYFRLFPDRERRAWYVCIKGESASKLFFLRSLGVEPIQVAQYPDIYENRGWES
ncbi:hypothetical protein [Parasphingorhabdus sp. NYA22]